MKNLFERLVLPVFGVMGTLITVLTFIFPAYANKTLTLSLYVITILFLMLIIAILSKIVLDQRKSTSGRIFNNFRINPIQYIPSEKVFLVDRAFSLPLNASITIYAKEGLFEKAFALGFVSHIQDDFTHVKIFAVLDGSRDIFHLELKDILLRPTSNVNDIIGLLGEGAAK